MVDAPPDTIMEEREELMVSPTGSDPTLRIAHFLNPSLPSTEKPIFVLPPQSLSTLSPNSHPNQFPLKISFDGWRNPPNKWKKWVDHMHSLHQSLWEKAGIHNAVMNSTYRITRNDEIFTGFAEKWCPETKSFLFSWGEATITLEDIMILGGYSVLGDSVLSPLKNRELEKIEEKLIQARREITNSKAQKASQSAWIAKFMGSGNEIEHEAFLALWLSRFVFPTFPYDTIGKNVFPIAVCLARGTKTALGPPVLATLYRDFSLLKEKIVAPKKLGTDEILPPTVWAPFQLLMVWVWERFPTLRPKPNLIQNGDSRLARWDNLKKMNIENLGLAIDSASEYFLWRPYATAASNLFSGEFYREKEEWVWVDSGLDEELWVLVKCLRVSELVGLDCIEQYLPHRVAMQFGMDQDLPGRVARANTNSEIAWRNYTRPIGDAKLYFPSRLFEADVTVRYLEWWNQAMFSGKDAAKAVEENNSSSISLKRTMLQSLNRQKVDNDVLVPPCFPPICNRVEERGSVDDDKQTLAEIMRNKQTRKGKPSMGAPLQSPSSSTVDNETVQKVQSLVKRLENLDKSEPAMEGANNSARDATESRGGIVFRNMVTINNNKGESSVLSTHETRTLELEARISKLEKVVAQLKAAKLGHRFGYKSTIDP